MSAQAIAVAIRQKFRTEVATPQSLGLVLADNEPPADSPKPTWYRDTISFDEKEQMSAGPAGARRYRQRGRVRVDLYERQGDGDGLTLSICDAITAAFQNSPITGAFAVGITHNVTGICFEPPPSVEGEPQVAAGWSVRTMNINFEATVFE